MASKLVESLMENRSNALDKKEQTTGKEQTGGMFDFIFRAKKRKEQELKDIETEENGPNVAGVVRG